jgi:hypothetical protein
MNEEHDPYPVDFGSWKFKHYLQFPTREAAVQYMWEKIDKKIGRYVNRLIDLRIKRHHLESMLEKKKIRWWKRLLEILPL